MWWYLMHKYFARKRKKHILYIFPPFDGFVKPHDKNKKAKSIKGDGIIATPEKGKKTVDIQAPIDGEVIAISALGDTIGLRSDNGVHVLVKVIATESKLKRTGVSPFVFKGQWVNVGDQLASIHVEYLKQNANFQGVAVVVTSGHDVIEKLHGDVSMYEKAMIVGE